MKKTFLAAIMVCMSVALTGCGGGHNNAPPVIVTQILSDPDFDGYIVNVIDPVTGDNTVIQGMGPGVQSVFAGRDPVTGKEYRAFLDFPLTGPGGVPGDAAIVSATLDIYIDSISLQTLDDTIPIRIDLVSFPQPMIGTDFDQRSQPYLATTTIIPPISEADFGRHVSVDVTSLMREAQFFGLADFQVRIFEDNIVAVPPGLIEINDTTGALELERAPLLEVTYF